MPHTTNASQAIGDFYSSLSAEQLSRIRTLVGDGKSLDDRWHDYSLCYGAAASGGNPLVRAKASITHRMDVLRSLLCTDAAIRQVAASPQTGVFLSLAFMITNKLVSNHFHDVDVVQLGVLLAQGGILGICDGIV